MEKVHSTLYQTTAHSNRIVRDDFKLLFHRITIMSQTFAEFLLDQANTGNEILAVLDDIVETVDYDHTTL